MTPAICPCDQCVHPRIISNPPGLTALNYRAGDFTTFREALLRSRSGEIALKDWHAGADGDLALQLLEWWAYLADVLTFYNERAMHESLLRAAVLPEDIRRLVRLLGYRPRPGIGATGVVAALTDSSRPFVLPHGLPIQSGSGPGMAPQVFELDQDIEIGLLGTPLPASARFPTLAGRDGNWSGTSSGTLSTTWTGYAARDAKGRLRNSVAAEEEKDESLPVEEGVPVDVAVPGVVTLLKPGDTVLILKRDREDAIDLGIKNFQHYALAAVKKLNPTWDELGRAVTVITLTPGHKLEDGALRKDYKLLKATKLSHLWLYHARYPGMKTPSPMGGFLQFLEQIVDPAGLVTGGISSESAQDPRVMGSNSGPWIPTPHAPGFAHLEAITRGIVPGDPVLFERKTSPFGLAELFEGMAATFLGPNAEAAMTEFRKTLATSTFLVKVMEYSEVIWYANPPEGDRIGQGPPVAPPSSSLLKKGGGPIPIPHSEIRFHDPGLVANGLAGAEDANISSIVLHYGWQDVGEMVEVPAAAAEAATGDADTPKKRRRHKVPHPRALPPDAVLPVLIEDATGAGVPGWTGVTNPGGGPPLVPPLRALTNLLPVSRGQTVANEVLGSGDAILINQEFELKRLPLTYLADTSSRSTNRYASTLRIRVGGVEWHEVATFYRQPPDARVFVTREDDAQKTHVRFGDGEFGARLPTGTDNVVATYRHGSGAAVPRIGTLTTILRPQPGLQSIRNPVAPGGGADPDPPGQIRRYAPRSVLTFGRAVSGDDYETLAAQTPGVRRARARWLWDAASQRTLVKVFVGDDAAAVDAARTALRAFADPNRPVMVELAAPRYADISFSVEVDPDYTPDAVGAAVRARLLDRWQAPFGAEVVRIGDVVYDSHIYDICMRESGVTAVHGLEFGTLLIATDGTPPQEPPPGFPAAAETWDGVPQRETLQLDSGERHSPGEGRFFLLRGDCLHISTEIGRHGH